MALRLGDGVERLPGIGPARARSLEKLGLATVEDLLRYFPRDYEDRRRFSTVAAAPVDTPVCLELLVAEPPHLSRIRKGLELVKARLVDDTGSVTATFFNQSYMKDALRTGETYVVYGRVEGPPGRRQMTNPVCERADRARFTGRILPIYPLTRGISNNLLAGLTLRCVEECAGQMEETLPAGLRREHALAAAEFACRNIHFPRDEEALELARQRNIPACTGFLSPQERASVENLLNTCGHPRHLFFGGYEGAERTVCAFLPDWQEAEDWQGDGESCPVRALRCTWSGGQKLTHRDFLGSILGLGLDREKVGDLLVGDGRCDVLALEEVADFLVFHMEQAGRVKLKCSLLPLDRLEPPAVETRTIRDTVSSLRLDAVAASGFSLSRGKAADLIASGRVQLNHRECVKPDHAVAQGDVLSCRGLGKCVLTEVGGPSKKGRILIVLERYV